MARLNEPAAPIETIESLKRKFMRQNRDIARANSTQSLRIRSLENETSRLLAENLGLRGEIAHLQNELEHGKAKRIAEHTGIVKSQLEAKLLELGALLSGLGHGASPKRKSRDGGHSTGPSPVTSPDQKKWKNMCTLSEAVAGQDGRLPPIVENKLYPRRTLEHQEIVNLVADAEADTTESPEIGPPPVSQFVDEDPVKIDLPKRTRKEETEDIAGLDVALSINLEQRRKRKESTGPSEPKQVGKPESTNVREVAGILKNGAKRKLSVRDDDIPETSGRTGAKSPDDFKFTRITNDDRTKTKSQALSEKPASKTTRELAVARGAPREKPASSISSRKILAPKSVNDSPRKKSYVTDDGKIIKPENQKPDLAKDRVRERRRDIVRIQPPPDVVARTIEVQPESEPETPAAAALDLFSPESSQPPSTARAESRDTPPPADLATGGEAARPSRRARGGVSYAEPSLRDKMRRPTKELVDAVARDEKAPAVIKIEEPAKGSVTIKAEPEADDAWKTMPAAISATVEGSPLQNKTPGPDMLPSSITTHRKRRESILNQAELEIPRTTSGSAITALLAETRRVKAARDKASENEAALMSGIANLDTYDLKGALPSLSGGIAFAQAAKDEKAPTRVSRRHSAMPQNQQEESEASDMEATRKNEPVPSRRRQSTLGLRSTLHPTETAKEPEVDKSLKRSVSTTVMADPGAAPSRSDRISARRRSMML